MKLLKAEERPYVSIEYCHIYTDEDFGEEHRHSIKILHKVESELLDKYEIIRTVLVDDYSPLEQKLDLDQFLKALQKHHATPDILAKEGNLARYAHRVLDSVNDNRLRKSYQRYIEKRDGYIPCSLFIAIWYLVRLGAIEVFTELPKPEMAITILPRRFETVETRGIELIANSEYAELVSKIEHRYFESNNNRTPEF